MKLLRDKLLNWEATPPPTAWDRICTALDESEIQANFPAQLREMETVPPASTWSNIVAEMDAAPTTDSAVPTIAGRSRFSVWMRYAAAAAILVFTVWGINELIQNNSVTPDINSTASGPSGPPAAMKPNNNLPVAGPHVAANDSAMQLESLAGNNRSQTRPSRGAAVQFAAQAANEEYAEEISKAIYVYEDIQPLMADKYVTLLTPDGSFIRLSKRWSHMLCCIAGEEATDDCDTQLKAWQDQMAASPVTPAPGSFMDILDLVNSVSDGRQL